MSKKVFICFVFFLTILFLPLQAKAKKPQFEPGLTGIQKKENDFYLLDSDSILMTGWQNYGGNLYYFSKRTGKMFFGVKKIKKKYYYFDENGCCVPDVAFNKNHSLRHGFYEAEKGRQYYFNGQLVKGFANILGTNYYFNEDTGIMEDYDKALTNYRAQLGNSGIQVPAQESSGYVTVNNAVLHDGYYKDPQVDNRTLLAAIIQSEAGNQKNTFFITDDGRKVYQGQLAVGYVIANRVNNKSGIKEVIYKKNQFTPARNGRLQNLLHNPDKIPEAAYTAADIAIDYINTGLEQVPDYPKTDFKWTNFWGLNYAKNYTNFFEIFTNNEDYVIIQDHVFFNYRNSLKSNT